MQDIAREEKKIDFVVGAATARLTGDSCSPTGFHCAYDTRALAVGTGAEVVKAGGDSWHFITADYAFGHQLEKDTSESSSSPAERPWAPVGFSRPSCGASWFETRPSAAPQHEVDR